MRTLKNCPFCGSNDLLSEPWLTKRGVFVECKSCGCIGPSRDNAESARILWNRRDYETSANEVRAKYGEIK